MKKNIVMSMLLLTSMSLAAQNISSDKVPAAVKQSFSKLYPGLADVDWELEDGRYEAVFEQNKQTKEAVFSADGTLIQAEEEITSVATLPKEVSDAFSTQYPGYRFMKAEKIIKANGTVQYEIDASLNGKKQELMFDAKGAIIK